MCRSIITILLSAIVALANAAIPATDTLKAGVLTPVMAAPALKLQGSDGKPLDLTLRVTDVFKKTNGKWLVIHEHVSWPVDLATGKADMSSKP